MKKLKTEKEIKEKLDETYELIDKTDYNIGDPEREYLDCVIGVLDWVLGNGDDPLDAYKSNGTTR